MKPNIYETGRSLNEYLLFHYGTDEEILPYPDGPRAALGFAQRTVTELLDAARLPSPGPRPTRALDLGCAVGRSTFELARHCDEVVGIDFSQAFIGAATALAGDGSLTYRRADEGNLATPLVARVPQGIPRGRVTFETGDAMALRDELGVFDVVHMANLIDRLRDPSACLRQLPGLVRPGGQLLITSPFTWLEEFTPKANWLGGTTADGVEKRSLTALAQALAPAFRNDLTCDLPFLIREHTRKFQWSVACGTRWVRC